jgi:hypothetical protein
MIRKLKSGEYRIYSRKIDAKTHKRKNLGTFSSLEAAKKHERDSKSQISTKKKSSNKIQKSKVH